MTKQKTTKRALLMSALALLLSVSMLVGSTFAWFTDSVTSAGNKIQAGTLKIDLELFQDGDYKSIKETRTPIFNYDKWDPGYVDVKLLKIENEGTLALKWYAKFISEKTLSKLADVIDVYVITSDAALSMPADRDLTGYTKVGTVRDFVNTIDEATKGTLEAGDYKYFGIALKMREEAGNEYQGLSLGEFDIQIFATQYTFEKDSFDNQYDKLAPFSVWNGTVPAEMPDTLVVDGATQTVHVKDADAFAYLSKLSADWVSLYTDGNGTDYTNYANGAGASYYYSGDWSVSLEADIDLDNHPIAPIEIVFGQSTGATAFNGNNHIIRNINTTTGLFADSTRATYSDLVLENVKADKGALTGISNHSITNVTVKNARISGADYVGGLTGRLFSSVIGCKVFDSVVVASGKEAGGLVGYAEANSLGSTIAENFVSNVTVYANNRAAGLVAQSNTTVKVYNNIVDTATVGAEDTTTYKADAIVSNALAPANVYDNTAKNCTLNNGNTAVIVDDAAALNAALNNGTDIVYAEDVVVEGTSQLNTGATIIGATFKNENGTAVTQTVSGTFKDCVFEGSEALRWCYSNAGDTVVFENCVIKTDFRGVHFDDMKGDVIFKNCEINGFNAIGGNGTVTFEKCTFGYDESSYNGLNMYSNINLIDCTFNYVSGKTNFIDMEGSGKTLTITNCKATLDGAEVNISGFVGGSKLSQNTVVYN